MRQYFRHLYGNWMVAGKAVLLFVFHFIHGLIPVKYTSHGYWGLRLKEYHGKEVKQCGLK